MGSPRKHQAYLEACLSPIASASSLPRILHRTRSGRISAFRCLRCYRTNYSGVSVVSAMPSQLIHIPNFSTLIHVPVTYQPPLNNSFKL